jgi:hypothetical protein
VKLTLKSPIVASTPEAIFPTKAGPRESPDVDISSVDFITGNGPSLCLKRVLQTDTFRNAFSNFLNWWASKNSQFKKFGLPEFLRKTQGIKVL